MSFEKFCFISNLQIDPNWFHPILRKNAQYLINNLSQNPGLRLQDCRKMLILKHDKP